MSGTKIGGKKAAATNVERYGQEFYAKIGSKGGKLGHWGGFNAHPDLPSRAGRLGGRKSTRLGTKNGKG